MERSHPTEASAGIPFALALTYHGFMMLLHQQANWTASLLHKTHGGLAFAAGLLRATGAPRTSGLVLQVRGQHIFF